MTAPANGTRDERDAESHGPSLPIRKSMRLPRAAYAQSGTAWLISLATANRAPHFADSIFAGAVAALLLEVAEKRGVSIDLYCFMPDHVHLLVQVTTGDLVAALQAFKSLSVRLWHDWDGVGALWQRSFHDRGLRTPADYDAAARYILANPVEAGIVDRWEAYPQIGGPLVGRL
jgi:putative transposase